MAVPSGGQPPDLTGLGAVITAGVAVLAFAVSLFRKGGSNDDAEALRDVVDDMQMRALNASHEDYEAQTAYVHQLQDYIRDNHLPVPKRDA